MPQYLCRSLCKTKVCKWETHFLRLILPFGALFLRLRFCSFMADLAENRLFCAFSQKSRINQQESVINTM